MLRGGVRSPRRATVCRPAWSGRRARAGAGANSRRQFRRGSLRGWTTTGALTLYDAVIRRQRTLLALGLQPALDVQRRPREHAGRPRGGRRSAAIPVGSAAPLGGSPPCAVRCCSTPLPRSRPGFMPTAALDGSRADSIREGRPGARTRRRAVARAFDGRIWQTVMMGEARAWFRRGRSFAATSLDADATRRRRRADRHRGRARLGHGARHLSAVR